MTMVTAVVSARRLKVGELIAAIYCRLVLQRGDRVRSSSVGGQATRAWVGLRDSRQGGGQARERPSGGRCCGSG
jgi:hypothetical protein